MATESPSRGARARHEIESFSIAAIYLFVCLGALQLHEDAVLRASGVRLVPLAFAAVKALILAKFLLVGEALRIGRRFDTKPLIVPLVWRSLAFLLLLVVLTIVEELVVGLFHGESVANILAGLGGGTWLQRLAACLVLWLVLVPYFAFRLVGAALGQGVLHRMFFGPR